MPADAQVVTKEWDLTPAPGVDAAGTVRLIHQPDGSLALAVDFSGPPDLVRMREDGTPGVNWNLVGKYEGMDAGFARSCLDTLRGFGSAGLDVQLTLPIVEPGRQQFTAPVAEVSVSRDLLLVFAGPGLGVPQEPTERSQLLACTDLTQPDRRPAVLPSTGAATLPPWLGAGGVLLIGIGLADDAHGHQTRNEGQHGKRFKEWVVQPSWLGGRAPDER
jgi:hypothetical protein